MNGEGRLSDASKEAGKNQDSGPPSSTKWNRIFGGKDYDYGMAVLQTAGGNYIVAGRTYSMSSTKGTVDGWLLKVDSTGNLVWEKTFGGKHYDGFNDIIGTKDKGFIAVGYYDADGTLSQRGAVPWTVKVDSDGKQVWNKPIGSTYKKVPTALGEICGNGLACPGVLPCMGIPYGFCTTKCKSDGSACPGFPSGTNAQCVAISSTSKYCYMICKDGSLTYSCPKNFVCSKSSLLTTKVLHRCEPDVATENGNAKSAVQTSDGGYLLGGDRFNNEAGWAIRLDSKGEILWKNNYREVKGTYAFDLLSIPGNKFLLAGYADNGVTDHDGWLLTLDSSGNKVSSKSYGMYNTTDVVYQMASTSDGGYVLVGRSTQGKKAGFNQTSDAWVVKIDKNLAVEWEKRFGGGNADRAKAVVQTSDGGYVVAGEKTKESGPGGTDAWVFKLDKKGTLQWSQTFGGGRDDTVNHLIKTKEGGFLAVGTLRFRPGYPSPDLWLIKMDAKGNTGLGKCPDGKCDNSTLPCRITSCDKSGFAYTCATSTTTKIDKSYSGPGPGGLDSIKYYYTNKRTVYCTYENSDRGYCNDDLGFYCHW